MKKKNVVLSYKPQLNFVLIAINLKLKKLIFIVFKK